MEYMLMRDGTVVVYTLRLPTAWDVFEELQRCGGAAYYWLAYEDDGRAVWYRIDTFTHSVSDNHGQLVFEVGDPPDMVKLATMLE